MSCPCDPPQSHQVAHVATTSGSAHTGAPSPLTPIDLADPEPRVNSSKVCSRDLGKTLCSEPGDLRLWREGRPGVGGRSPGRIGPTLPAPPTRQRLCREGFPGDLIGALPVRSFIHPAGLRDRSSTIEVVRGPVESAWQPRRPPSGCPSAHSAGLSGDPAGCPAGWRRVADRGRGERPLLRPSRRGCCGSARGCARPRTRDPGGRGTPSVTSCGSRSRQRPCNRALHQGRRPERPSHRRPRGRELPPAAR